MELKDLTAKLGLKFLDKELAPDAEGRVALTVDGIPVTLQQFDEAGKLLTIGEVGDVPPEGMEALAVEMLKANYLYRATGGGTLSLDEQANKLHLSRFDDLYRLDQDSFEKMLEGFVNALAQWHEIVRDYHQDLSRKSEASGEAPAPQGLEKFMFLQV